MFIVLMHELVDKEQADYVRSALCNSIPVVA